MSASARWMLWSMMVVVGIAMCLPAWSQSTTCYEYQVQKASGSGFSGWHSTPEAACAAGSDSGNPQVIYALQNVSKARAGENSPYTGQCSWQRSCVAPSNCGVQTVTLNYGWRVAPNGCPPPDQCDDDPALGVGQSFTTLLAPSSGGGDYCNAVSKCRMRVDRSVSAGGTTLYTVTHTNEQCSAGQEPTDDEEFQRESCTTTSGGNELCISKDGENCGWLNGEFLCLPQIDHDGCDVFSDSSRLCGPDAPTPPVPDNGTPGQPADPDDVIQSTDSNGNETTYNYYNNNTVGNSARPPGNSGDNPFDGEDDGTGAGTGLNGAGNPTSGGNGGGGSGGDGMDDDGCTEEDGCSGTLPSIGEEGVCESFAACTSEFWSRVSAAPIVAAVANAGSSIPAGACPAVNISMFGDTNSLSEPMCSVWSGSIAPIVGVIFLVMGAWISTRVVLSA